jgi:hypothetical protein
MRRFILVALMAVPVAGCDRFPDLSIQVAANLLPSDSSCTITADQEDVLLGGTIDLSVTRDYVINPQIESYLIDNSLDFQGTQNNMQVDSLDITILLPDHTRPDLGADLPNPYQVTTSVVIPPSTSPGSPSFGAASAIGIPSSYYDALSAIVSSTGFTSIVLEIRANGTTSGGFSNQSPSFFWPVYFCNGCLGIVCEEAGQLDDSCYPGQDVWQYCASVVPPA